MSLTSVLQNKDVKAKFAAEFKKPKLAPQRNPVAAPVTQNHRVVGTAFDYTMRFILQRLNPQAVDRQWVCENPVVLKNPEIKADEKAHISEARKQYKMYLETGELTDDLLVSTLHISRLDAIVRRGDIRVLDQPIDTKDVQDLRNLIALVDTSKFTTSDVVLLNPTFGGASSMVGGADADFIIGDMLVEIKTTKELEFLAEFFNQLLGYYSLAQIGGIDGAPKHEIKHLAIYYSRYGVLQTWNIDSIINQATFPVFLNWFQEYLKVINHH